MGSSPVTVAVARVAGGQQFPDVAVGLVPVDDAAAVLGVDLHVHRTVRHAAVGDARGADAGEDRVEFVLGDAEAVVHDGKVAFGLVEVEGEAVIDIHRAERAHPGFGPGHAEQVGELFRRGESITGGHQQVVELDRHGRIPPYRKAQSRKLSNCSGRSKLPAFSSAIAACRSSRFLPVTRSLSPLIWRVDLELGVLDRGLDLLGELALDALLHRDLLARAGEVGLDIAEFQAAHVDAARDQAGAQDVGHLLELEVAGRGLA